MDPDVINRAIDDAVAEANALGIHGKATTPFCWQRSRISPAATAWIPISAWCTATRRWRPYRRMFGKKNNTAEGNVFGAAAFYRIK